MTGKIHAEAIMLKTTDAERPTVDHLRQQREFLLEEGRSERVRILMASHRTEACLAAPAPGRERAWKEAVFRALSLLRSSLTEASERGESAGGLVADLKSGNSRYFHRVDRLQQEFDEMIRRCDATLEHLRSQGADEAIDYSDIRQRITWLLTSLKHHQAREADLIYEAYGLDLGIGES